MSEIGEKGDVAEKCPICRRNLNKTPLIKHKDCTGKAVKGIAIGRCKHRFHITCIELWCKQREVCPICNRTWKYLVHGAKSQIKSLSTMCCKVIAKRTSLVLDALANEKIVTDRNWQLINRYSKSHAVYSVPDMNKDMRQTLAKHFYSYYPHKEKKEEGKEKKERETEHKV